MKTDIIPIIDSTLIYLLSIYCEKWKISFLYDFSN